MLGCAQRRQGRHGERASGTMKTTVWPSSIMHGDPGPLVPHREQPRGSVLFFSLHYSPDEAEADGRFMLGLLEEEEVSGGGK